MDSRLKHPKPMNTNNDMSNSLYKLWIWKVEGGGEGLKYAYIWEEGDKCAWYKTWNPLTLPGLYVCSDLFIKMTCWVEEWLELHIIAQCIVGNMVTTPTTAIHVDASN